MQYSSNNNNNKRDKFYSAIIKAKPLQEFTQVIWIKVGQRKVAANS